MSEGTISVHCACGKKLKAPASAEGRKARCPNCSAVVVMSAAERVMAASPPLGLPADFPMKKSVNAAPAATRSPMIKASSSRSVRAPVAAAAMDDDPFAALSELAEQEDAADLAPDKPRCPGCRGEMEPHAVLCTNCGYDTRTGKSLVTTKAPVAVKATRGSLSAFGGTSSKPVLDYMAPTGSFALGLALAAAFALAASLVWIGVAYLTGFAIGYIAILIGGAAGLGMRIGHKGYSKAGGIAAAALTLASIFLAKYVVLLMILQRAGKSMNDIDSAKLGLYFFSPIGLIIIAVGVVAAYKAAEGSVKN